jgi:hypothetical protein
MGPLPMISIERMEVSLGIYPGFNRSAKVAHGGINSTNVS